MSGVHTNIIENMFSHVFRVRSGNTGEYSFRDRSGFITCNIGKNLEFESGEITGRKELVKLLPDDQKRRFLPTENEINEFDATLVARQGNMISSQLNKYCNFEWEIIFKTIRNKRVVKRGSDVSGITDFSHNSVLIRFKRENWHNYIEIGEGDTEGLPHNISGLTSRLESIIRCNLEAEKSELPSDIPVILTPGEGGIFFHEILGHSLEADHILKGLSPFTVSDIGKRVVSDNITISTFLKEDQFFKNINCDDEGNIKFRKNLIEKGELKHIISDTFHSHLLGISETGSLRTENFMKRPLPRMYAIYLRNGKYSQKEIMESTKKGIIAKEFGDGKVLFNKNLFYFNIPSAYMIRNGRIREPLGSIIVSGKINEMFNSVEMVADDFSLDRGISYCYKDGQTLNVRVGQPTVKINNLKISRGLSDI